MSRTIRHAHAGAHFDTIGGERLAGVIHSRNLSRSSRRASRPATVAIAESLAEWSDDEFSSATVAASGSHGADLADCSAGFDAFLAGA